MTAPTGGWVIRMWFRLWAESIRATRAEKRRRRNRDDRWAGGRPAGGGR